MGKRAIILLALLSAWTLHAGELADTLVQARITGGLIVLVNGRDASYDEAAKSRCAVHGLETDTLRVAALRNRFLASAQYGRISVRAFSGKTLPYVDNLINLVVIEDGALPAGEVLRVLCPRGIALTRQGGVWTRTIKPVPDDIDEWNQYLHDADNNAVSSDKVGPPERLQWTGGTRWGRSHMSWVTVTSMLSAKGRVYTIEDLESPEYHKLPAKFHLIARDAFNGCELWRRPLNGWHQTASYVKFVPTQIQRRMAAIDDKVYCTLGYDEPITILDGSSGKDLQVLAATEKTREFVYDEGVLYVVVGAPYGDRREPEAREVVLKALRADSGERLWEQTIGQDGGYVGGTLAVKGVHLAYCTGTRVFCHDARTGGALWSVASAAYPPEPEGKGDQKNAKGKKKLEAFQGSLSNTNPTLVLAAEMVYCATVNEVKAYALKDGSLAWTGKNAQNYMKSSDLFVAGGLVWTGLLRGHDPKTGEVKRTIKQQMDRPMGHDRCYRNRITERYYINSKTGGSDFLPLQGQGEFPGPWLRATCGLGVLPCNGLLYSSPYSCSCLAGNMLTGFNAVYSGDRAAGKVMEVARHERLIKGPAYGNAPTGIRVDVADWPVYRNDNTRSGSTASPFAGEFTPLWQARLPSRPTAPTIAGDLVYVAARDAHTLYALARETGKPRWTFTAGGRIDSPPAFHKGFLLFGSRDGWVHCVRADNGVPVWQFSDLPEQLVAADEQLESAWPISGAVMVRDDIAYFAAGRSSFLDGGIVVYALNPLTGEVIHRRQMSGPYDAAGFPIVGNRNTRVEGFKGGVFSSDGELLYIRHQAFKPDLTPVGLSDVTRPHLIASGDFLDDVPQHRTYWTIDTDLCYGPNTGALGAGPQGDILAMDGDIYYEIRGYLPGRHSTTLDPLKGYTLYSGERVAKGTAGAWQGDAKRRTVPIAGYWKERWSTQIPLTGNALVLTGDTLIAAGVPLLATFTMPQLSEALAGTQGGVLWMASAKDGARIAERKLPAQPVWDGLAVAHGQCFLTLKDGTVMCLGTK